MEKDSDSYNDADLDEVKVKIKQVEALIKELKLSIGSSTTVFESLHAQVSPVDGNNHIHHINRETVHLKKKKVFIFRSPSQGRPWTGWKGPTTRTWFC